MVDLPKEDRVVRIEAIGAGTQRCRVDGLMLRRYQVATGAERQEEEEGSEQTSHADPPIVAADHHRSAASHLAEARHTGEPKRHRARELRLPALPASSRERPIGSTESKMLHA
jgi:hypothetical protein